MNRTQYFEYLMQELADRQKNRISVSTSIAIVFVIVAWGSNFTVCYCVLKTKKLHSLANFFLVFLSMADLVQAITVMPLWIDVLVTGKMNFSQNGCKFTGFMLSFCDTGKLLTIYTILINRLCNIYRPSIYAQLYHRWASIAMVIITWSLTLVIVVVMTTVGIATIEFHPGRAMCVLTYKDLDTTRSLVLTVFTLSAVVPLCINIVCHIKAYHELKEHKREARGKIRIQIFSITEIAKEENESKTDKDDIQATRTLLGVVYAYALCNILTTSIVMADSFRPFFLDRGTHLALTFFLFVNSVINPLIFSRTSKTFRDVYVEVFGCKWNRSRVIHVQ
ncbi:hypothetical protein QZH41_003929 [Actinostola sp. cb2023]|nr:hypothetical protein QZH41_003929 [Actinostola sp. cb2023]